jgi:hypothetical protein
VVAVCYDAEWWVVAASCVRAPASWRQVLMMMRVNKFVRAVL